VVLSGEFRKVSLSRSRGVLALAVIMFAAFFFSLMGSGLHPALAFIAGPLSPIIFTVIAILLGVSYFLHAVKPDA